ncbi:hypothetical protein AcdelDRAFT_0225 [Acidovorax delafieldii 2AN]|uniref:Transmembrane protein n=1 Tax=Acidovorax delafieldii 2AN TaxID=573060 RepID=C5SZZ5_ACIDE|nr:hypothetical protein [Acidovorax delafieldii]EER62311.1 hypothetical protein AcdelDRAFT_0225 [Acidovorax delafieldii 2AN]
MSHPFTLASAWDTSSVGEPADISLLELSHLGEHLEHCVALRGQLERFLAGVAWLQAVVAEHVVTVALLITLLVGAVSLVG